MPKIPLTGKTWYGDVDVVIAAGTAAKADTEKIAHLQGLFGLKTKIAAAVVRQLPRHHSTWRRIRNGSDTGKGVWHPEAALKQVKVPAPEVVPKQVKGLAAEVALKQVKVPAPEAVLKQVKVPALEVSFYEAGKGSDTGSGSDAGKGSGTDKGNQPKDTPSTNPKGGDGQKKQTQETPAQPTGTENANSNSANSQASTKDTLPSTQKK